MTKMCHKPSLQYPIEIQHYLQTDVSVVRLFVDIHFTNAVDIVVERIAVWACREGKISFFQNSGRVILLPVLLGVGSVGGSTIQLKDVMTAFGDIVHHPWRRSVLNKDCQLHVVLRSISQTSGNEIERRHDRLLTADQDDQD